MTLLQQLDTASAADLDAAMQTYREIIARADTPQPDDLDELREAMRLLGLNSADVARDISALNQVRKLRGEIYSPEQLAELEQKDRENAEALRADMTKMANAIIEKRDLRFLFGLLEWAYCEIPTLKQYQERMAFLHSRPSAEQRNYEATARIKAIVSANPRLSEVK